MQHHSPKAVFDRAVQMLTLGLYLLAMPTAIWAGDTLTGRPARVISGDRLVLLGDNGRTYPIRLAGIITPPADQRWGAAARRQLHALVMGRVVSVYYDKKPVGEEILGQLRHGGSDINLRMLQSGLARTDPQSLPADRADRYADAERQAQRSGMGAWREHPGDSTPGYRRIPGGPLFRIEK